MPMVYLKSGAQFPLSDPCRHVIHVALRRRAIATCFTLVWAGFTGVHAADISVAVNDREGHGIADVAVTVTPTGSGNVPAKANKSAVMDQANLAFTPRVLVIGTGTSVAFPNSDTVSHQVYSFSPAKRFQLPLYKGQVHPPVTFDHPGLVVLGCNIHDVMVGYILVTDAPYFGKTGPEGNFELKNVPNGEYRIGFWSPYIIDAASTLDRTVQVSGDAPAKVGIQLSKKLRAQPEPKPRRKDWEY